MSRAATGMLAALFLLGGCGGDNGPSLAAEDVSVLAPLPGQEAAVAYLTLTNGGPVAVEVTGVTSPEFASVAMHATVFSDGGIAEMLHIDSLSVAPHSAVEFTSGGRHLMLMEPRVALAPGDEVTLEFHYGVDEPLRVSAPIRARGEHDQRH